MEKVAVYTSIIGHYDKLLQPAVPAEGFDFICFVGKGEKTVERDGVWEIRELPWEGADKALTSRYPKMHPHVLLPEYTYSLWVDGNVELVTTEVYDIVSAKVAEGVMFSGMEHPSRDCIYAEARKCRDMRYIGYPKLAQLHLTYLLSGIPRHAGLMEANVMLRCHNAAVVRDFDEMWWSKVVKLCRRDQLSQVMCLRKFGLPQDHLLPAGFSTCNHPAFRYCPHVK